MSKKLQQFEFTTMKRSEIKMADYNPRLIDDSNQKKLIKAIRQHGLVEPLVVNKRNHILVSGHQRLTAADHIFRKDYEVPVALIDVDEKTEKILNVQLNNPSMQGEWNLTALASLSIDDGISFDEMGFNKADIDFMYDGDIDFNGNTHENSESRQETPDNEEVDEEKDKIEHLAEFNEAKASFRRKDNDDTIIDFYVKVIFPSNDARKEFFKKANIPINEQYVTIDQLKRGFDAENKER